ncbi:MAG: RDD family protein, partial [Pseudonocardiaceae bacterium]
LVGAFIGTDVWSGRGLAQWAPLAVFAVERWLFTSMVGASAGQLVLRIRVIRTNGRRLDPSRALARALLVCLVVPPVIYNRDQRGLHDLAVDSVTVRM